MKLLVTILTDKNIDLLHRAICSVFYQFKSGFKVCVYVVVNTLNDLYYEQVCNKYADNNNLQIYRTESNGLPGKGHNSCLELFKNMPECEYFTMLDGDDMYYPCAFQRFEQYIKRDEFDLLHVMTNDRIKFNNAKNYANKKLSHNFLLVSCFNNNEDFWKTISVRNPFTTPINKCATPTRIILMKRSALNAKIRYGEKLRVFDDMVAFCTLLDAHYSNKLNAKAISDTYIYLYNLINPQSVSFKNIDNHSEDKNFKEEMKNIKNRKWELDKLPFLELEPPDNFTTEDKISFAKQNITDFQLKTVVGKLNNFIKIFAKSKCPTAASKIIHSCNLLYYYGLDSDNNLETLYEIQKQSGVKMQIMQSTEIILTKHYPCQKIIEKLAKGTKLRYYNILFNKYKYVNNEEEKKEEKDSNNHEKKPGPVPLSVCIDISLLNFNNIPIRRISNKYSVFVTGTDEELKKISPPKNVKKLTRNEVISRTFSHCILSDLVTSIHYFDLTKSKNYLILETLNVQEKETSSPLKVSFQNFGSVITKYVVKDHFNSNDCLNMNIDPKNAVQWRISELFFWNKMIPEIFK